MVLKRFKVPKFVNDVAQNFPTNKHVGVRTGAGI